ncbi:hypothetical protein EPVG_00097 [Emiliania huxleyi virus 201]|nr:hypothetical protein ELVG_00372 [Emiliania huxleyi virus 203]AEP15641.1 hypothetical protein EQVG_00232 [Emiliania huxleyi virus 207]AEP16126.1 hypothetical protein ERVG_00250 [Emiliania huxleyi virus 208]AET97985.1 hypothetical protein EPVG_00097 [Emiliania huxleyi virus 201]
MHPAPASGRACRGCIRRTRREFAKYETNYNDALVAHRAWTSNLNQDLPAAKIRWVRSIVYKYHKYKIFFHV